MRPARLIMAVLLAATALTACAAPVVRPGNPSTDDAPAPVKERPVSRMPEPIGAAPQATTVAVEQREGAGWRPLSVLDASTPPGPSELRFHFSKPVRKEEVEQALTATQPSPVRGRMHWPDDQTLIWQISEMPPRLDLLLGGAHDTDGLPLPGGLPSLRLGPPPTLVEVDPVTGQEEPVATLPADIISASKTAGGKHINVMAWTPGTTPWDWRTTDVHVNLENGRLEPGRVEGPQPRVAATLEAWMLNPLGTSVAGLRMDTERPVSPQPADLVVADVRGNRQSVFADFITRFFTANPVDFSVHLAWSGDGVKVAALSHTGTPTKADLVTLDIRSGERTVLMSNLPVTAWGTRLAWSPDNRYILAGNLLIDLNSSSHKRLAGHANHASGVWDGDGHRLLYSAGEWEQAFLMDPSADKVIELGAGYVVGWSKAGRPYLIRWPASSTRYLPPGM